MKVNSLIKKTALAVAVAGVSFTAAAGTLTVPTPAVLANEIFGTGSETTAIRLPQVVFTSDATSTSTVNAALAGGAEIKLTLGGDVTFAQNYQDANAWAAQGVALTVGTTAGSLPVLPADIVSVVGGTAGDNQITITLAAPLTGNGTTSAGPANVLQEVTLQGFQAKNLKAPLERKGINQVRTSKVTLEVRGAAANEFENTNVADAFVSIDGVKMTGTHTGYTAATPGRARIQVASDQMAFTGLTGAAAAGDFDATTAQPVIELGTLTLARGVHASSGLSAGKETGADFDFTGGDTLTLSLNSDADLTNYGALTLQTSACGTPGTVFAYNPATKSFPVTTADIDLGAGTTLNLCADVTGITGKIPQASFDASMEVTYFNTRYTNSEGAYDYERVLRNGCSVTLFNLPNATGRDVGNIRFTNTSATQSGEVSVSAYAQDGSVLASDVVVLDNLAPHATALLQSRAGNGVDLSAALGDFEGRARIQINGAFPSCEALGLVSRSGGDVVNMTSTVYSGSANGTSNTDN